MPREFDLKSVAEAAVAAERRVAAAVRKGGTAAQIAVLEQQAGQAVRQAAFAAMKRVRDDAAAAKRRIEAASATKSTAERARELSNFRDIAASMTNAALQDAIHERGFDPLNADYSELAALGAEARKRGLVAEADLAGRTLAKPRHEHDREWQTATADVEFAESWARRNSDARDVQLPDALGYVSASELQREAADFVKREQQERELDARMVASVDPFAIAGDGSGSVSVL